MLLDQLQADLKSAQLARDEVKVSTLRLLLSEVKNREISKGEVLPDEEVISVVQREVKKRKEAAEGFRRGDREDSAAAEELEAKVLESYLPVQMSSEELTKLVEDTISEACQLTPVSETGAASLQDMGKIIRLVMDKSVGRADGGTISALVKEKLTH
ncbi:MAG: GatB/YqeY domain-containing protein [Candidatus Daviesbacteria bacterium]|nr:GatB/YqeY domain-containing protein [Candidatus Daviesbacteria bacterium]